MTSIMSAGYLFSAYFGMMLKISARLCKSVWCVSFNVANGAAGMEFCNTSIKSRAVSVAASAQDILGIFTLYGKIQQCPQCGRILCLLQKLCNADNVIALGLDTTMIPHNWVQPKMSPTISFSGMYQKSFIYRRNRTNSQ